LGIGRKNLHSREWQILKEGRLRLEIAYKEGECDETGYVCGLWSRPADGMTPSDA
jgi:hypothetical protein